MTLVWAFKKITELNGELGFVEVDDALAVTLLAAKKVDKSDIGALNLTPLDHSPIVVVTKTVAPAKAPGGTTKPPPPPADDEACPPEKKKGKGKK